jgi:hypothetical protein
MYDYGWRPYVSAAERRRKAEREMQKLRKKGHPVSPVARGPHHRPHVLGQGVVRQSHALQRLLEPPATRPHLRAQRLGGRPPDRARRGESHGQRLGALPRGGKGVGRTEGAMDLYLHGLRRRHRLARRAAAGAFLQGGDGTHLPREDRSVPCSGRDRLLVQLPRLGLDVQARRCRALRRRVPASTDSPSAFSRCARWRRRT